MVIHRFTRETANKNVMKETKIFIYVLFNDAANFIRRRIIKC
jgi:hypothetical protein